MFRTRLVVVADSCKPLRRDVSVIAKVEQIHILITGNGAPRHAVEARQRRGVEVRLL